MLVSWFDDDDDDYYYYYYYYYYYHHYFQIWSERSSCFPEQSQGKYVFRP